jgi:hypothetical protein
MDTYSYPKSKQAFEICEVTYQETLKWTRNASEHYGKMKKTQLFLSSEGDLRFEDEQPNFVRKLLDLQSRLVCDLGTRWGDCGSDDGCR